MTNPPSATQQPDPTSLLTSQKRLRMMVEHLPAGALYREGQAIVFNRAVEEITGYQQSELSTLDDWFTVIFGEDAHVVRDFYEQDRAAGFPITRTVPLRRKDGQTRLVEFAGYNGAVGEVWMLHDVTQRVRTEEALRSSEEEHRLLVEHSPYCIHQIDCSGHLISMNPAGLGMLGVQRESQMRGNNYLDLVHEQDRPRINEFWRRATAGQASEFEFRAVNGLIIQSSFVPILDGDGLVARVMGISQDITQRKRAEDAVQTSESKFRAIFNGAAIGIAHGDPEGRSLESNFALQNMLGYSADELRRMKFTEFTHPDDIRAEMPIYRQLIAGQREHYEMDKRYIAKNGKVVWGHLTVYLVRCEDDAPSFAVGMIENISERKRAEEAIRDSESKFRALFEGAAIGITRVNLQGRLLECNPALERMLGYDADELRQMVFTDFTHPEDAADDMALYSEILVGKRNNYEMDKRYLRKDGKVIWGHLTVSMVRGDGGEPLFAIGMVENITERKLAEERLVQAERLSAIGEAMTGLAHESRNALQRSQACLTMLSNRIQDSPQLNELIVEIQQAQDDLHQLYEGVRRYAAPGKLKLQSCHLPELLHETWNHLASARADRQVQLRETGSDLDLGCDVDQLAVREVFRNILENAISAADSVSEIDVEYARVQLDGRAAIRITIGNNGPGLDAEQQARIFDAFYTTSSQGTGLGMAIAKRLVEEHGGEIAVGTGAERKATLVVTLPTRQA